MTKGELLYYAVTRRSETREVTEMLLGLEGIRINATMYEDHALGRIMFSYLPLGTPLHAAAKLGNPTTVHLLLSCGADPSTRDSRGQTAEYYAAQAGHEDVANLLRLWDVAKEGGPTVQG